MIICEIGLNHMGDIKYANEYIDKIIKSNADGILFHIREKSFYETNPKLLLPDKFYINAIKKIKKHNIKFLNSEYIKTQKNQQVEGFYNRCGFNTIIKSDNIIQYQLKTDRYKNEKINYIRVKNGS